MTQSLLFMLMAALPLVPNETPTFQNPAKLYAGMSGSAENERQMREFMNDSEVKDLGSALHRDNEDNGRWGGGMPRPSRDTALEEAKDRVRDSGCKGITECSKHFRESTNVEDRRPASEGGASSDVPSM